MNPTLLASPCTILADPDRPDRDALFAVLDDTQAESVLACLASPGSLVQIAAAMAMRWSWCCDRWDRHTDELVELITDPRCPSTKWMITTWSSIPSAIGVLRDRTDTLIAWAQQLRTTGMDANLALLLGPSNASARFLMQSPSSTNIGRTLRHWSMAIDPDNPTAWQAMIDATLREPLRRKAHPSWAFPAWGWDDAVASVSLREIVDDLADGWSPDLSSIRGRIRLIENHVDNYVDSNLNIGPLAVIASIGRSDTIAEAVCAQILHHHWSILDIVHAVPWSRLHPRIQTIIDQTMRRSSTPTWACAIGQAPLERDAIIDPTILLWRIDPERWETLDTALRAALVTRITFHSHCFGWGVHPDLVTGKYHPNGRDFRYWNPDVPPDDIRAWNYTDLLLAQKSQQDARELIALLMTLPQNRRTRFEQIIDWRVGGRFRATAHPPWDWTTWVALPAAERQARLRDRLAVLWGDRATLPAVRFWHARNDGLATLALMVGEGLGLDDPSPILAALLTQIPVLRGDETDVVLSPPFPDDLDATRRAQIERLPLAPADQAYAAWCLRVLARHADVGAALIALHPDVAIALAPLLTADQQKAVAASPATQGWNSMTNLRWAAACAAEEKPTTILIQRRIP